MITACIQTAWLLSGGAVVLSIIVAFIGICDLLRAFCRDIIEHLADLNNVVVEANNSFTASDRTRIATEFYAIIEFHSKAKQLSIDLQTMFIH